MVDFWLELARENPLFEHYEKYVVKLKNFTSKKFLLLLKKLFIRAFFGKGKILLIQMWKFVHQSKALLNPKKLKKSRILIFKIFLIECFKKTKSFEKKRKISKKNEKFRKKTKKFEKKRKNSKKTKLTEKKRKVSKKNENHRKLSKENEKKRKKAKKNEKHYM